MKKVMEQREEFTVLQQTVSEIASLAISKHERDLTKQQKTLLKAFFGDSTILHTLKKRLADMEDFNKTISELVLKLVQSVKLVLKHLLPQWQTLQSVIDAQPK